MTTSRMTAASSISTKRDRPSSPPRRRRTSSPPPIHATTHPAPLTSTAGTHSALYQSLFPSDTQLVPSLPLPTLPPPTTKPHTAYEEKQQLASPAPSTSPRRHAAQPSPQLLSLSDVPLVQRENVRLAAEMQRVEAERDEVAERERQYREQHDREMREVSSSYQHMQFMLQQAKAQIAQQQHTIDQLRQQLHHKHNHATSTASTNTAPSSSTAPPAITAPLQSFHLTSPLAPAAPTQPAPPPPAAPPAELAALTTQLSTLTVQLQRSHSDNDWLQSTQASLVARLRLAQSELGRVRQMRAGGGGTGGGGWSEYVDGLREKEKGVEYNKLKRDVDWLNEQLQASQQLVAAYENKSSSHPASTTATAKQQHKDELDRLKLKCQQADKDKATLKAKLEAMELELFTTEEQRLIHDQTHQTQLATTQQTIDQLTSQLQQKDATLHQLHLDVKAMQAVWDDKERSMQSGWMATHRLAELRDKVDYLTAVKRDSEDERERLKRRTEELTAELIVQSGRHEEEVVGLRKEALKRDEERRQRDEEEEERRKDWHRSQVDNARLKGEMDVLQKRCEHYQQELTHYKNKLADSANRSSTTHEDEQRLRNQLDSVQSELSLLKAELESVRSDRVRLIEESNSLSMLLHSHEETIRELTDARTTLTGQLQQRDRDDQRKREELEAKGEWTREEAERLIRRQQDEVGRVRTEMGGVYERLTELRREKTEMYEMLKVCDMQLVKVQLEFKRMEEDKAERERELQRETEMRQRADDSVAKAKQDHSQASDTIQLLTTERDDYALKERQCQHTLHLARMELAEKDEQLRRVADERDRKVAELGLCMRREEDVTARYWAKEREVRELGSQLGQAVWGRERAEKEVGEARGEKERALRRVEEVETVVRHMDVMSFARDEEVKALMGELDSYRAELMRRVEEVSTLKETIEAGKDREDAARRQLRELEARIKELEREVERRRDELVAAMKQCEVLQQADGVYRQVIEQLQSDVRTLMDDNQAKDRDNASHQQQLASEQQTTQHLTHELSTCRSESGALMADLKLLLQENAIVQAKLSTLHDRETTHLATGDTQRHTIESLHSAITQQGAASHALQQQLRSAALEVDRLGLALAEAQERTVHGRGREKALEADVVRLELEVAKREDAYRQLVAEVDGWKRQNEELVRVVDRLRAELAQQADDQQVQRREMANVRQLAQLTETARADTQRAAAEQLAVLNELRDDRDRMEREKDAMKADCEASKLRLHHLELLITTLRRELQSKDQHADLAVEAKATAVADLQAQVTRLSAELDASGRELERVRLDKDGVLSAMRGGAGGLQGECVRLTRLVEVLEEDKKRLKGYLLRYEREVKRLEAERDRTAGGGGGSGGSAAGGAGAGNDAVDAVRRRVEGKEKENKRDER